jgi:phosphate:Na+ symporter
MAHITLLGVAAGTAPTPAIDGVAVTLGLFGGLALFLLGMDRLTAALKLVAGDRLRNILARLTSNRFAGAATGAGVTAVIQSSSVTTVLIVGFISSGLMTLQQSVGLIMGANIGTTVTAQIIAFRITKYALGLIALGFGIRFVSKNEVWRAYGGLILGLGLVFFGMSVMGDAMSPLRSYEPFQDWMAGMSNPAAGILAGAVFTALIQSSSATTGVVLALAFEGLLPLDAGIALVLGANVGTCVTALLAAIGKPRAALRAAWIHTGFNIAGALIWVALIPQLADLVSRLGGGVARQIANAHTIFNVTNTLLFIGFTNHIAALAERLVPDRPDTEVIVRPRFLDPSLLHTPSLALDRARLELLRMAERVKRMLTGIVPAVISGTRFELMAIEEMDDEVDSLHGSILSYLGTLSMEELGNRDSSELLQLMEATNNLEAIGDIIETNLVQLGMERIEYAIVVSAATEQVLRGLHEAVIESLDLAMLAVTQKNVEAVHRVGAMKSTINSIAAEATVHEAERLVAAAPNRIPTYRLETDIISNLRRIYYFAKRTARMAIPAAERAGS